MTLWNDDVIKWKYFRVTGLCAGNSPVTGEFPAQRPVIRSFAVFFDLHLNQQLSKQWRRRWFETHRGHYDVIVMEQQAPGLALNLPRLRAVNQIRFTEHRANIKMRRISYIWIMPVPISYSLGHLTYTGLLKWYTSNRRFFKMYFIE